MRAIRLLNLRRIRRQPLRALIGAISVAAGITLSVSILIVQHSYVRSLDAFARTLAGPAPLRVVGPLARGGLDAGVLDRVEKIDGVAAAVPVVQAIAYVAEPARHRQSLVVAFGVDCRIERLLGEFGCDPAAIDQLGDNTAPVVSASLQGRLTKGAVVRTDEGVLALDDAIAFPALDALNGGNVVVLGLGPAQRQFARPGSLDTIYVLPDPSADLVALQARLEAVVGPWNGVLRGDEPPPGTQIAAGVLVALFGMLSVFALAIGSVLIRNSVALALEERRRDLAIVAAVGGTPRLVIGGTLAEAALMGIGGGGIGAVLGLALAHPIVGSFSKLTEQIGGVRLTVHMAPVLWLVAALLGAVVAVLSALGPARRATRIDVAAELGNRGLREEIAPAASVRRTLGWLALAILATDLTHLLRTTGALDAWQAIAAQVTFLIACLGLISAVGSAAPPLFSFVARRARRVDGPAMLGLANLVREPKRTRVGVVATAAAIGIALSLSNAFASIDDGVTHNIREGNKGTVAVTTLPATNSVNIEGKLAPAVLDQLARLPEVGNVQRSVFLAAGVRGTELFGVEADDYPSFPYKVITGTADLDRFTHGEVLVGAALARRTGVRAGGTLRLPGRTGWLDVRVQGVWYDGDFNGNKVYMPMWMLVRTWGPQPPSYVSLTPADGVSIAQLAAAVRRTNFDPFLRAQTPDQLTAEITEDLRGQLQPFWALQRGMLTVAFIAVLFSLLLAAVQRRRELALLGAVGMQPLELARMVVFEALAIGAGGIVLGIVASFGFSFAVRELVIILIGYENPVRFAPQSLLLTIPVTLAVVAAASLWPAWRTARTEVLDGLRYE